MTTYEGNIERVELRLPRMLGNQIQVGTLFQDQLPEELSGKTVFLFASSVSVIDIVVADEVVRLLKLRGADSVLIYGAGEDLKQMLTTSASKRKLSIEDGTPEQLMLP